MSPMFRLKAVDFGKGLITAALAAVCTVLYQAINVPGFDLATFDWAMLWQVALTAGTGYILKNLFTNEEGKFAGAI